MLLLIPGPVTTRPEVRAAMAADYAPWDQEFRPLYAGVRARLAELAGCVADEHAVLPLQGCGHFAVEAAIRSLLPPGGRILIPLTGSYAARMARLAKDAGRDPVLLPASQVAPVDPDAVARALAADPGIGHVGLVYSETSSGVVHDPVSVGAVVRAAGRRMLLDAVSAFGALPLDLSRHPEIDAAVFTANKCLESMPGLAFAVARVDAVTAAPGEAGSRARSWSFDLADIYQHALRNGTGSFRFTPPAQVLAALRTALALHAAEGGAAARLARYTENASVLHAGMRAIGLTPYLPRAVQGPVVLNVHAPDDPAWSLQAFVDALKARGFLISNFFDTELPSFRVGCIGAVTPEDFRRFVAAADSGLAAMGVRRREPARLAA
jgi:2-aminoethylphosphonate-pyruvate transaminase